MKQEKDLIAFVAILFVLVVTFAASMTIVKTLAGEAARITLTAAGCKLLTESQVPTIPAGDGCLILGRVQETHLAYAIEIGPLDVMMDRSHIVGLVKDPGLALPDNAARRRLHTGGWMGLVVGFSLFVWGLLRIKGTSSPVEKSAARLVTEDLLAEDAIAALRRDLRHDRIMVLAGYGILLLFVLTRS